MNRHRMKYRLSNWLRTVAVVLAFQPVLHSQERCGEEVKLLLSPAQVHAAISSLGAGRETHGRVYFYDTPALDLLSKGMVLRLRVGKEIDLTAKLRPTNGDRFVDPTAGRERYKCEVDLNDGVEAQSFSVQNRYAAAKVPTTGEELRRLLSDGQKKLLDDAKVEIDWKSVKRMTEIRSTTWTASAKAPLGKLSLELWEWPGGSVLELSTKVAQDAGRTAYGELQNIAKKNGLAVSANQHSKTAIALREMVGGESVTMDGSSADMFHSYE